MENDYKRNYFWIKRDLKGNKHYYFKIKGQYHEVSEEVYKICYKLFIKNPIIRINTVFFKEIAIKNRSFYHEFTTFERALI